MVVKLFDNFSNRKPHDNHGFKKEVKIKYNSVKAIAEKFSNGTVTMMILLAAETIPLDWVASCALTPKEKLAWEERNNELNKVMLYLMNSKNKQTKKDLRLLYSQGIMIAYKTNIEAMAQYLST